MAPQQRMIVTAEDPTILVLPANTLPPDLVAYPGRIGPPTPASASPFSWLGSPPVQGETLLNANYASGLNAALNVVLNGGATSRIHIYSILCRCAPAGASAMTIQDGNVFLIPAGIIGIGAALTQIVWPIGLTITENHNCTIAFTAAGVGNTVLMLVQADRF